ncbi:MAG: NifU family protein [Saprospiraceae bacterium]
MNGVYITNNFVTISKEFNYEWSDIMLKLKDFIKKYVEEGGEIIKEGFDAEMEKIQAKQAAEQFSGEDGEIAKKIKELIDTYVKPAVEMDGGNIEFKAYDKGKVYVIIKVLAAAAPSSSVTLEIGYRRHAEADGVRVERGCSGNGVGSCSSTV